MNTLSAVTKNLMRRMPKVQTTTVVTIAMALGADMLIKRLPVATNLKAVMRVATLAGLLIANQKMAVMQAVFIAALYIAIVSFLADMTSGGHDPTGPTETAKWTSAGTSHAVTLRGHTYTHEDPVKTGPVEVHTDGPTGYLGHENAPFTAV